jgi:hypothetical protein
MWRLPAATSSTILSISGSNQFSSSRRRVLPTRTHTTAGELSPRRTIVGAIRRGVGRPEGGAAIVGNLESLGYTRGCVAERDGVEVDAQQRGDADQRLQGRVAVGAGVEGQTVDGEGVVAVAGGQRDRAGLILNGGCGDWGDGDQAGRR